MAEVTKELKEKAIKRLETPSCKEQRGGQGAERRKVVVDKAIVALVKEDRIGYVCLGVSSIKVKGRQQRRRSG